MREPSEWSGGPSDIEGKTTRVGASEWSRGDASDIDGQTERSNGASGKSDIEGKAARVAASKRGQRTSFNRLLHHRRRQRSLHGYGVSRRLYPAALMPEKIGTIRASRTIFGAEDIFPGNPHRSAGRNQISFRIHGGAGGPLLLSE